LAQTIAQIDGVGDVDAAAAPCRRCASTSTRQALFNQGLAQTIAQIDGVGDVDAAAAPCRRCASTSTRQAL
ncbi:hypothetical protein CKQ79_29930, partial [Klebsiella pneumoniae]